MTPEQQKTLERCAAMLKQAFGELKRIVFDLAREDQKDTIHYEIHGKVKA